MHDLAALLPHGSARRDRVTLATSSTSVSRWLTDGDVVLLHPGVLALPDRAGEWPVRARAAVLWARGPLSHLSALAVHQLVPARPGPLHVTVPADRWPRGAVGVTVHRTTLTLETVGVNGLPVLDAARSLVDAWAWSCTPRRNPRAASEVPVVRQAVIEAVRTRAVDVDDLRAASAQQQRHSGRRELVELLDLVAGGCQSELEVFGVLHVLRDPRIPPFVQQHRVALPTGRTVYLDAAWPRLRVAVELDGAAFHGSREQRERDMRRDTALATLGWVVLRFSYRRLVTDPAGCRREIEAVLRRRLADL
ncbi:DUF559 domain-containing protein [Geodermatophilus sp. DSM 44513]|uniref:DUF559 domain-containing protein n=1 Tax=Geodermatophilus sp. DSM 44513 TaxID=1528104 RepID=UPI001274AE7D|nr:DUF559 domain-containing protein [Geodermatophilus sp. DSM 44513]WNV76936.1 DUF559 domain-containing protein [Geodermatophilus sp. DSM 44513]